MVKPGANYSEGRCEFVVWAPEKETMTLLIDEVVERKVVMDKDADGYFIANIENLEPKTRYKFLPEGSKEAFPDPASHFQPEGVHGSSEVVDHDSYVWNDQSWSGLPFSELIVYELHIGTFTKEGTFEAVIPLLPDLVELGINAIELMPVAQFPGNRNWGYDGVFPFSVQNSYGGPEKLKELVDAAHAHGISVFLDVVFNHIGPEGNYFEHFGPYFTSQYETPWGNAINLDGEYSDGVRHYFSSAVRHWYQNYHLDGLRVDAVHMMFDNGAVHFWEKVHQDLKPLRQKLGREYYLIAESDLNSPRVTKSPDRGGWAFDAQWLDDFHHSLYVILDQNGRERYEDFGKMEQLAKAYTDGFVHSGEYVKFRKRRHGSSSVGVPGDAFVVFNQNHDQVGNRVGGERLCMLVSAERQKLAAAAILLAPYVPMLFMGEEYASATPFFYFISHSEESVIKMVVEGRQNEFANYNWDTAPPNPQEEETFLKSKLDWNVRRNGAHLELLNWHKELIALRKSNPALQNFTKNDLRVSLFGDKGLALHRQCREQRQQLLCVFNFGENELPFLVPAHITQWKKIADSREAQWMEETKSSTTFPSILTSGETMGVPGLSVVVYEGLE